MNLYIPDNEWDAHVDRGLARAIRNPRHVEFDQKARALGVPYTEIYEYRLAKFNSIFRGRVDRTLGAEQISSASQRATEIEKKYPDLIAIYHQTIGPDWESIET